jgi:ketosteroid isomerase-like protein
MSQENEETVRRMLAAWAQGDFTAGTAELDPQVAYIVRPPFPETAAVLGLAAVGEYMDRFLKGWKRFTIEANEMRRVGDTILVDAVQSGEGDASGATARSRFFMLFTFRGGRIIRIESILDEREALEAAGLSE